MILESSWWGNDLDHRGSCSQSLTLECVSPHRLCLPSQVVHTSARTGAGLTDLAEALQLQAEMSELQVCVCVCVWMCVTSTQISAQQVLCGSSSCLATLLWPGGTLCAPKTIGHPFGLQASISASCVVCCTGSFRRTCTWCGGGGQQHQGRASSGPHCAQWPPQGGRHCCGGHRVWEGKSREIMSDTIGFDRNAVL
jgi:hypothetical protein